MSIFSSLKSYAVGNWEVSKEERLSAKEIASILEGTVVDSKYGLSAKLLLAAGGCKYIPLSRDSSLAEGDDIEPKSVVLITLSKEGENDIVRLDMK